MAIDKGRAMAADSVRKARSRLTCDVVEAYLEIEQDVAQPAQLVAVRLVVGSAKHRYDSKDNEGQLARHDRVAAFVMAADEQVEIDVGIPIEQGPELVQ